MNKTRKICLLGILIALVIVLSSYCQIPFGSFIRLDLGYAVVTVAALYMGGIYGAVVAFIARIINDFIFSGSISIWWAIGSAFYGLFIGISYKLLLRIKSKIVINVLFAISTVVISFISFVGIVPLIAHFFGISYLFMVGIGIIAAIMDAIVALVIGYPSYLAIKKIKTKRNR